MGGILRPKKLREPPEKGTKAYQLRTCGRPSPKESTALSLNRSCHREVRNIQDFCAVQPGSEGLNTGHGGVEFSLRGPCVAPLRNPTWQDTLGNILGAG